jgi:SAM-dependent methyltransferase
MTKTASTTWSRKFKRAARILRLKPFYQEQRSQAADHRWSLIERHLRTSDRNLLDIGCNIGELASRCAARGIFTMGIDALDEVIAHAVRRHKGKENLLFGICDLDPSSVRLLPRTDVTLCLSVHHYWHRSYGEAACWEMVAEILDKTPRLFFEPASSHVRYGVTPPAFANMDEGSIDHYVFENLARLVKDNRKIEKLGRTPSIRQESFRTMYLIS